MGKVAVVYWSSTGNTEAMAQAVAQGAGCNAIECDRFSADDVDQYDAFAFGCPAMGSEELEPELEEVYNECAEKLAGSGKKVGLFGSYDWGDGEWMETWESNANDAGLNVIDTVICNLEPEDDALAQLTDLGSRLAADE